MTRDGLKDVSTGVDLHGHQREASQGGISGTLHSCSCSASCAQDRMVVVLANLKPRNMRKIKSFGMVMAASNEEHTVVEPIAPPAGAVPGERIFFADTEQQGVVYGSELTGSPSLNACTIFASAKSLNFKSGALKMPSRPQS
eukprot:1160817-Pelagomonas_calceolata.AAC.3